MYAALRIQNQIIHLTEALRNRDKDDTNILIELSGEAFDIKDVSIISTMSTVVARNVTREEVGSILKELHGPHFNLFFKFNELSHDNTE